MKKINIGLLVIPVFAAGVLLALYPSGRRIVTDYENGIKIKEFQEQRSLFQRQSSTTDRENKRDQERERLRFVMQEYNEKIFEEHQQGLCDAWSYQTNEFDFAEMGIIDNMAGYISIDAMGINLPLYIGANAENMSKGAAVLSQTSMPVGGKSTNCVIAAHRGWKGADMFLDIEVLKPGDEVTVTNLWESLHYKVVKSIVIDPDDIDAVKIFEGLDMVTLVTCHPYAKNEQRYVVYCSRSDDPPVAAEEIPFEGEEYKSSEPEIKKERNAGAAALFLMVFGTGVLAAVFIVRKI